MSESKHTHTAGPWIARYSDRFDNYQIFGAGPTGQRPWICNTKCESVPSQHEANARLIAAAPELLEALKKIADLTARCEHDGGFDREIGPIGCLLGDKCVCIGLHPIARAAISKASPTQTEEG